MFKSNLIYFSMRAKLFAILNCSFFHEHLIIRMLVMRFIDYLPTFNMNMLKLLVVVNFGVIIGMTMLFLID